MKYGTIVLLNGASSSGKTSILKALQETLEEPYLDAGLDKFIWMLPGRFLERPLWDEILGHASHAGPLGHQLVSGMHHAIVALSKSGINVLADHVLVEPQWLQACASLFSELPAFLIGVRCPLEVLEQRRSTNAMTGPWAKPERSSNSFMFRALTTWKSILRSIVRSSAHSKSGNE